jgi:hypothetical protein
MNSDKENRDESLAVIKSLVMRTASMNAAGIELDARMETILVKLVRARRSDVEAKQLAELLHSVETELTELQQVARSIARPWNMEEPDSN